MNRIPRHVTLTLDGNRRWEKENKLISGSGHKQGYENAIIITEELFERKVEYVTLWALSHDNLKKRSKIEISVILKLLLKIEERLESAIKNGIKIDFIGDLVIFDKNIQDMFQRMRNKSKDNTKGVLTIALNYGGENEIERCIKSIIDAGLSSNDINIDTLLKYADTGKFPAPDLSIRTGGDQRTSGFFPITGGYAELYFPKHDDGSPVYWPDFNTSHLDKAFDFYAKSRRNFGK